MSGATDLAAGPGTGPGTGPIARTPEPRATQAGTAVVSILGVH